MLIVSIPIGGFIGAFLFYMKPELLLPKDPLVYEETWLQILGVTIPH